MTRWPTSTKGGYRGAASSCRRGPASRRSTGGSRWRRVHRRFAISPPNDEALQSLLELVDVAVSIHGRAKETVRIVDLMAAVVEEADVARDELPRAFVSGMPAQPIEDVGGER